MSNLAPINEQRTEPTASAVTTPATLLAIAVQQGADLERLEKLMELQERWEANEARKAFVAAMNAFKANPPELFKNKHVKFETSKGVTEYDHATLDHISTVVGEALSKQGLSHRWNTEQLDGGTIRVTCVITHAMGHSESTALQAGSDQSGGKNNIQAIASTVTYLERYTLLAATGLATKGADDDGRKSEQAQTIDENQIANLEALIEEVKADKPAFLRYLKLSRLEDLPSSSYSAAVKALEAKRKQK